MRKAFQRCTASLPKSLSSSSRHPFANRSIRFNGIAQTQSNISRPSLRSIHQSSRLRQQAAETQDTPSENNATEVTKFRDLDGILHKNVVGTLTTGMGLETMTEVQSRTINSALKGVDIVAQAKTGTGKTIAFLLPVLQNIINVDPALAQRNSSRRGPRTTADDIRALIISPTRELAEQIAEEARKLVRNTSVIVQTAVGGTQKSAGLRAIQREGCHILVGTPGRLKDILSDSYTRVEAPDLSALVFDEADRLLDQGFWPEIQQIMDLLPRSDQKDRQTLMFSATVPKDVVNLVRKTLKPGFEFVQCVREDDEPTHERVPQHLAVTKGFENNLPTLVELCHREIEKSKAPDARPFKAIVYFPSTAEVNLASVAMNNLRDRAQPAEEASRSAPFRSGHRDHPWANTDILQIHAKLSQQARTRAADDFRRCRSGILLSSDVTARGMDFPDVTHVIQMGIPSSREQYIHRIGRTGRAGKEGEGWVLLTQYELQDARRRLTNLPIKADKSLEAASLDLTKEAQVSPTLGKVLAMVQQAMPRVSIEDKSKVYLAMLGVYQALTSKSALIAAMNDLAAYGWGLKEPPAIPHGLASKLGLSRIPGVRIGTPEIGGRDSRFGQGGSRSFQDRGDFGGRGSSRGGNDFGGRGSFREGGSSGFGGRSEYGSRSSYGGGRGGGFDRPRGASF